MLNKQTNKHLNNGTATSMEKIVEQSNRYMFCSQTALFDIDYFPELDFFAYDIKCIWSSATDLHLFNFFFWVILAHHWITWNSYWFTSHHSPIGARRRLVHSISCIVYGHIFVNIRCIIWMQGCLGIKKKHKNRTKSHHCHAFDK